MVNINLTSPIIVIGMHRSGTSLLTKMLEVCGVFWGKSKDEYNESIGFQSINEQLFAMANATWDKPEPVESLFSDPQLAEAAESLIRTTLDDGFFKEYFIGQKPSWFKEEYLFWGWKDPRSIFTLPVWMRFFPDARIIHIVRNGLDVSASLWLRETTRPEGHEHPHYSLRCQSKDGCFRLWKKYVERARHHVHQIDNAVEIRFEDLLENPESIMFFIADFIGLELDGCLEQASAMIRPERRFAYIKNPALKKFRCRVSKDVLLKDLGYSSFI
jgi:hypothetical protein